MQNSDKMKWFVRVFALVLLLLMAALYPLSALTQGRGNLQDPAGDGPEGGSSGLSDRPEGQPVGEPAGAVEARSNLDLAAGDLDFQSTGRTDDPLGRVFIPLEEGESLPSNSADQASGADENSLTSAEAMQLEAALAAEYTSPLVVPAADFASDGFDPDSMFFTFAGGNWVGEATNYGCIMAPAYLPDNVTVTDMFVSIEDSDATFNMSVSLRRVDNFTGSTNVMATANSSGSLAGIQTIWDGSINNPVISYPSYSYYVTTCVQSASLRLYSARLYYAE